MSTSPPIVTSTDLEAFQGGDVDALLDQANAVVRGYCGWHVAPVVTQTVTLVGSRNPLLALPSLNVTAVSSVTVDGVAVDVDAYTWSAIGVLRRVDCWWNGFASTTGGQSAVEVTFTHGYDSVPDLARVILALANRMQDNPKSATRVQAGPFAEQYGAAGSGFTLDELAVLRRYRIPVAP